MNKSNERSVAVHGFLAVVFIGVMGYATVKYGPWLAGILSSTDAFRDYVLSFGDWGGWVFLGFMIMHILIPAIPGEIVQIAGGYIFGTLTSSLIMIAGMMIGTVIAFYLSRFIGYPIVKVFVKPQTLYRLERLLDSPRGETVVFIMMLIPGFPKDTLVYIAGLTPMQAWRFLVISLVARTPGLIGSAMIGANIQQKDYWLVAAVTVITIIAIAVGVYFRNHPIFRIEHDEDGHHHVHLRHREKPGLDDAGLVDRAKNRSGSARKGAVRTRDQEE